MATATANKKGQTKTTEPAERCDARKVKVGSVYSRQSFGIVTSVGSKIGIKNEKNDGWEIDKEILEKEFSFADQFDKEEEVNRTQAIDVITDNPQTAMTINYNKAVDADDVAKALKSGQGSMSDKDWKALVKAQVAGEERTIIGHHFGGFDEHRRLQFFEIDSSKGPESKFKLVDPRTVNSVIVNRTKYTVKSK